MEMSQSAVTSANSGLRRQRLMAEKIDALLGLDECDLNAVERSRVSEDDSALREIQRLVGEEIHPFLDQVSDILFYSGDLQREMIDAFVSRVEKPGNGTAVVVGSHEADGGIAQVETGPLEARVGVVGVGQHPGRDSQDFGVGGHGSLQVLDRYAHVDEAFDHAILSG